MIVLTINDKSYKVIKKFKVLWEGWELDNEGYLVEGQNKKKKIVFTSHGMYYFPKKKEIEEKIQEYSQVLNDTITVMGEV